MTDKQVRFEADEELVNNFDSIIDSSRSGALRNCMEASVAHGKLITEVDVSGPDESGESGVTNHDLLVAIQNSGSTRSHNHGGSTSSDESEFSAVTEGVTDEMAMISSNYDADADELPDAMTPDGRDDVLSREALKQWAEWADHSARFVPKLNPDHVDSDHRPQGMTHAVALTRGVLAYREMGAVKGSQLVDVVADDLGWTRNYMESNGFSTEIEEAVVQHPFDDSKYIGDRDTAMDAFTAVGTRINSKIDTIESASSLSTIDSAYTDAVGYAYYLGENGSIDYIGDRFSEMDGDFSPYLANLKQKREQEVSESTVESARLRVDELRRMFSEFDDVDGLHEIRKVMNRISDTADDVRDDLAENTLEDTDVSDILSEIDVVVSEAGVVAGEAAADELRVMTSVVGDADDVEGVEESLSEIVDGGEKAKKMVDSYVDDMADVDVGDVMSEIDAAVSDAAVTAGEAVTAEMREMNTAFNGQKSVAENEDVLDQIEELGETARRLVEENTTYDTDVREVMAGIDDAVSTAEERHSEALEVAVEREVPIAEEKEETWAQRTMRVLEVAEMDDSPMYRDSVNAIVDDYKEFVSDLPDAVKEEASDISLPVSEFHSRRKDLPTASGVSTAVKRAKYSMSIVEIVERLDLDEIEDRDEAYAAVSEMSLDVVPDYYQDGGTIYKAALEQAISRYSKYSAGNVNWMCSHSDLVDDAESIRERVARAVYEYESAVNDEDGEWVIVEETKKSQRDPVPGVLRVDMREYTEFDESLDQRYWSDETDWESRLPDESESESVSAE